VHLYYFLIVIVALSCGSLPPTETPLWQAAGASAAMVAIWILLSHVAARLSAVQVRKERLDPMVGVEIVERQLGAFRWLGLGVSLLCLAGFGLARTLTSIPVLEHSMFLQALILLAPGVAITVGTWSAEHSYGVMLKYTNGGIRHYLRTMWQSFRSGMAWLIAPVLILLGMCDLLDQMPISEEMSRAVSTVAVLIFVPLVLPWLIRHLFKTAPLDQGTEQWVRALLDSAGLRRTRAVRWDTGGQSFNAMVAGFVPPLRTLLISDRLVDQLPREQIAMVVLHEAAHLRRRHVPLRLLSVLPAWGIGAVVTRLLADHSWATTAGTGVGIVMSVVILRLIAYRTEFDADVQACKMAAKIAGQIPGVPATYEQAAEALSAALVRVTYDHLAARKATWLHPGVADRANWMRRHLEAPTSSNTRAGTIANPA
jgi:Zn-dependent protease with chaperone function